MKDIAVKNIHFSFERDEAYQAAESIAVREVKKDYLEEQEFCKEEYNQMLADGDIQDMDDYLNGYLNLAADDINYLKPFEENKDNPQIQAEVRKLTEQYMANIKDLPKDAVVQLDDSDVNSRGKANETAVLSALEDQFGKNGVSIVSYEAARPAEKKDLLTQQAYESVKDMMQSKEYQSFLQLRASIQKYSHNNICLIYSQKPDAKAVMGFNAWKKLDRHVDAGQQGISIWQPCTGEKKSEKAIDDYIEKQKNLFPYIYKVMPDGTCPKADALKEKMMKELNEKGVAQADYGFKLGATFDISQTVPNDPTKDNLADIVTLNKPLEGDLANYADVLKSMKDAATLAPFVVTASDKGQQEEMFNALMSYADNVLANSPEKVTGIKSVVPLEGDMHKIETVMTAYMIAEHIGIETGDKAGLKLAEIFDKGKLSEQQITIGKREMFMKAFDRAANLADMFTKDFDKSFGIDIEAQRDAIRKANEEKAAQKEAADKAYKETHTKFGRTDMLIADSWKQDKTEFTVGKNEKTNIYFVKAVTNHIAEFIRGDDGKPMRFDSQPDRNTAELLLENQRSDKAAPKADTPAPDIQADADDKADKKADIDI